MSHDLDEQALRQIFGCLPGFPPGCLIFQTDTGDYGVAFTSAFREAIPPEGIDFRVFTTNSDIIVVSNN